LGACVRAGGGVPRVAVRTGSLRRRRRHGVAALAAALAAASSERERKNTIR